MKNTALHNNSTGKTALLFFFCFLACTVAFGQGRGGAAGIEAATSEVTAYFDPATRLMYAIGAVLGLIGAVRVYSKWNSGDPDTQKVAAGWFGSCIFLVVVATILRAFFF
jgi:hypothetical protein